jgi:hypothetical protein
MIRFGHVRSVSTSGTDGRYLPNGIFGGVTGVGGIRGFLAVGRWDGSSAEGEK